MPATLSRPGLTGHTTQGEANLRKKRAAAPPTLPGWSDAPITATLRGPSRRETLAKPSPLIPGAVTPVSPQLPRQYGVMLELVQSRRGANGLACDIATCRYAT